MAGITLADAESKLALAMAAYEKALEAESYSISAGSSSRSVTRDLSKLEKAVEFWDKRVKALSVGGIRVRGATPT